MRIAVRYSRNGPARYVSHLDMQRAIGRAVRRARLHACYSQGFNPHLKMSFASPLSVGYETKSDYLELEVADDQNLDEALRALQAAAPPGIGFEGVYRIPDGFGKLMARCHSAAYDVRFILETPTQNGYRRLEESLEHLKSCTSCLATDKKGRQKDIRPLIYDLSWLGDTAHMQVANSSGASLNPQVVADMLLDASGCTGSYAVTRTECFASAPDGTASFVALFSPSQSTPET